MTVQAGVADRLARYDALMRIVHVITRLIIGGAQENTILSCEGLAARGHEVHLLAGPTTGPEGTLVDRARAGSCRFEEVAELVRPVSPLEDFRALAALRSRFSALRPDVVHTHSSKAGVLGRMAAFQAGVPAIVHTIHGMSFNRTQTWPTRRLYSMAERYCAKRCHAIVSVADAMTRQSLAAGVGRPDQFVTIRSGIVTSEFDPAHYDSPECRAALLPSSLKPQASGLIIVGTVARLFPNKGYEPLIEIMRHVLAAEPNLHFVWVGDGSHRSHYLDRLARLGLRDRVTLTGLLPPREMPRVLAGIDILAHTSEWEGLPRAVVQAQLMETPAVAFDIDGAPEVIHPGRTGELVPLGNVHAFAEALVRLARNPTRRRAYGETGRALCLHSFDVGDMVQNLESLYERLARERTM
jgi:glycosyltransferase involved in cell wall biosynthesis